MNKITVLNHKIFQIHLDDESDLDRIRKYLSFKLAGVEYSPAFKSGAWDGMTCMLNSKNQVPVGLLPRVRRWMKERNLEFSEDNLASAIEKSPPIDLQPQLQKMNLAPRDYQERIAGITDLSTRGIIRACTGAGKTLAAAMMIAKLGKPANLLVISLDLLEQFHQFFTELFQEEIGYIGDGVCKVRRINIVSIWSVGRALDVKDVVNDDEISNNEKYEETDREKILRCLQETPVFLLDECHVASTNTIKAIYKAINPEYLYGLSGTPFREDNSDLLIEGFLSEVLIDVSASELIAKGHLVQPWIKFVPVPAQKMSGSYQEIYREYIVENTVRNNLVLQHAQELVNKGYKPLVLFKQIKHGDILEKMFKKAGLNFGYLSGKDDLQEREIVKKKFREGKLDLILASTIFDIGLNLPEASGLILAGGGKSETRSRQKIGRVVRTSPGKKIAAVVDFYDQVKYLKKHSQKRHAVYSSEPGFRVGPLSGK